MSLKSDSLLAAWGAFFVAHALSVQKIEKALSAKAPLTLYEYDVLLTIDRAIDKKIRYSDLASVSIFTRSGITRILQRLESRGLIDRLKCESDRRGAFAQLNKNGAKALKETWALYAKEIVDILDPALTQSDGKELEKIMGRIIDQVKAVPLIQISSKEPT